MDNQNILLSAYQLNDLYTLKNRIFMAPMTRAQASDDSVPTIEMAEYYARRAAAGLIITEGTLIHPDAKGHRNIPGIFNDIQIKHWKWISDKVHQNNGLIFMQLWHVGRVSHPVFLQGKLPISSSETTMTGKISRSPGLTFGKSRAATQHEIKELINYYALAAKNAIKAGFDGIELHGANGYLIDQFLHYHTNKREDEYGNTPENMSHFAIEIVKACGDSIGYERVGLRLSPGGYLNEIIGDERDYLVFQHLLKQLNQYKIAYVHTGNFNDEVKFKELHEMTMTQFMRQYYTGNLIACGNYTFEHARERIEQHDFDLVSVGRPFIANPDLIERLMHHKEIVQYTPDMLNVLY